MAREARSQVHKRRQGCITGCLTRILLLLGLCALLFVGACVLGLVRNDPVTGAPSLSLDGLLPDGLPALPELSLPEIGALESLTLPAWAYGVQAGGLTVKTLRAGEGEAVLVCCDGYTMLLGGGSGMGVSLAAQLLLCRVNRLDVAAALSSEQQQIGGLPLVMRLMPPDYLLFQDSQVKGTAYNRLIQTAQRSGGVQMIVPQQGLTFSLGRSTVTVVGPARTAHTDGRDDGLSVRVDFGQTSVLIAGSITSAGERELITSGVRLNADVLICAQGGGTDATCAEFVAAVSPAYALMTAKEPPNSVKVRLQRAGAQVYTAGEYGVMTVTSDGYTLRVDP